MRAPTTTPHELTPPRTWYQQVVAFATITTPERWSGNPQVESKTNVKVMYDLVRVKVKKRATTKTKRRREEEEDC